MVNFFDSCVELFSLFFRSPLGIALVALFDVGFIFSIIYTIIWWKKHGDD